MLLAAAVGCSEGQAPGQEPLRVQVFTGAYFSISIHVADEKGFFAKHGLTVEKLSADSSSAAIAALVGGSMDIVHSAADLVMANIDKGTDLKYLLSNESTNYVTAVVGNHVDLPDEADGYPAVIKNLSGRRIGVNVIGSTVYLAAVLMFEDAGVSLDDVEFVATGTAATTMAAWRSGSVDVQITSAPVPELLSTLGLARPLLVLGDDGPHSLRQRGLWSGWVTTGDFIAKRTDEADAFIAAMSEAIDWIRDPANGAELLALTTQYAPVTALSTKENNSVMAGMIEQHRRFWGVEICPRAIEMWNDYALHFDLIKNRIAFDNIVYAGAPVCNQAGP